MPTADTHIVINTNSRRGALLCDKIVSDITKQTSAKPKVHKPSSRADATRLYKKLHANPPKLIIICGGDGTVSSGLAALAGIASDVAIIPLGTTNNTARTLQVPLDLTQAIDCALHCKPKQIDMGVINTHKFANVASFGISTLIASGVSDRLKKYFGRLAYALSGLRQMLTHKPFVVTLRDPDNDLLFRVETHQFIIANGTHHAGQQIAIDAKVNNNQLMLFGLGGASKISLARALIDFYFGKQKRVSHHSYSIGRNFSLSTSRPMNIEIDGEVISQTPAKLTVQQNAIKVRRP